MKILWLLMLTLLVSHPYETSLKALTPSQPLEADIQQEDTQTDVFDYPNLIATYQPNEMGKVMVIMYHNLVEEPTKEGYYARTWSNFERDLERLYALGFRPVSMTDLVTGQIDLPAGLTPFVLTFDDGHASNFQWLPSGALDPQSAVGILERMGQKYSDFEPKAIFYLNGHRAFGDPKLTDEKASFLLSRGYELGNHTWHHENLKDLTLLQQHEQIVKQCDWLFGFNGQLSFHFSLPFGKKPEGYLERVSKDAWLEPYKMMSSVNVGWNPTASPFDMAFNPLDINRVTVGDDPYELHFWLDYFEKHPEERFISDGLVDVITLPDQYQQDVDVKKYPQLRVLVYGKEGIAWLP